ncbi:putative lipase-like protein [Emericellopsis cladophorae]|uniref:Lipase-like protein n=1 Tax=Emericellopsis cladophorae TaxID=2686198 RepID=A0A9P9Y8B6_9HYPO|nr:putative lipase-like protein [Emericellopsis cladophorae]KAI6785296.1 putative lipase-like protein [Emericellopsis cladophorae]
MLLVHQTGSVKVGEVIRYTVTYTPSQDRILPSPEKLYLRIKNTSAIALRAAFVHGPYTLSVAAYPQGFNPNEKFASSKYGVPEFEPMVKAGGSWECELIVPEDIRQGAGAGAHGGFGKSHDHDQEKASWVVEVSSQVIFSTSAAVGYEVLLARDKKSLSLGGAVPGMSNQNHQSQPGKLADHQQSIGSKDGHHAGQPKGIFSGAVQLSVEDTASLWNTPRLPEWDDKGDERVDKRGASDKPVESMVNTGDKETQEDHMPQKQNKVHLVVLTHGLHSNLGADMLFIKESIDAAVAQAKIDRKERRAREKCSRRTSDDERSATPTEPRSAQDQEDNKVVDDGDDGDDDDEEVIVRGYSGNATKTERGIKYLGKRLARYVLSMTYPDQPFLPVGNDMTDHSEYNTRVGKAAHDKTNEGKTTHKHSTGHTGRHHHAKEHRPYKITSISFIAHSLGGLVQTYAVAYIQKHSPEFFTRITPINFIALATPFLGLSNENPMYVKFALDFGLVGRTGKDLGLTWRAPTLARSGWGAIVGNLGETAHKRVYGESQPESKPLLRILPTGPAHTALKKFRNRTVYSNVVNDGIVPLRTSCLLFLDWHGLGRVEKARRDAGLVETMVGFGWAELTGTNMANTRLRQSLPPGASTNDQTTDSGTDTPRGNMSQVPQPSTNAVEEDDRVSLESVVSPQGENGPSEQASQQGVPGPLSGFFNFFRSNDTKPPPMTHKQRQIYDKSQTKKGELASSTTLTSGTSESTEVEPARAQGKATTGQEFEEEINALNTPPRTTFFEAAGDLLNPHVPDVEYLVDPAKRPRTIFHDRVYHPQDIPAPPMKKRPTPPVRRRTFGRSNTGTLSNTSSSAHGSSKSDESDTATKDQEAHRVSGPEEPGAEHVVDASSMRVEEKIARGYHRDLSWRKVLVKLEPDAHNNIFVRRMFVNAYGWPVVKHICDAHFSDSAAARMRDEDEVSGERALDMNQPPHEDGGETKSDSKSAERKTSEARTNSESREAEDKVPDLRSTAPSSPGRTKQESEPRPLERGDSMSWSDRDWVDSEVESDVDFGEASPTKEWNWKEKIVGKGGNARPSGAKSPRAA